MRQLKSGNSGWFEILKLVAQLSRGIHECRSKIHTACNNSNIKAYITRHRAVVAHLFLAEVELQIQKHHSDNTKTMMCTFI